MNRELADAMQTGETRGALINAVEPESPAAKAGLQPGDVITRIEGRDVRTPRDLAAGVAETRPGSAVTVALLRNGQTMERRVEIGTNPANRDGGKPAAEAARPALGLGLAPRREGGVSITQVQPGSVAAERGLRPGDVIRRAGDRETAQPSDVVDAVTAARNAGRPSIALQIERDQGRSFVALPLRAG